MRLIDGGPRIGADDSGVGFLEGIDLERLEIFRLQLIHGSTP